MSWWRERVIDVIIRYTPNSVVLLAVALVNIVEPVIAEVPDPGYKLACPVISEALTIPGKTLSVNGEQMYHLDIGDGDPILFLHGNPTSSYLWRNVIPHVATMGRAIAPDLIGMGRSSKPSIDYGFADHYRYLDAFIAALELHNITLVVHDWGAALGFEYARRNPKRVKRIAFMEGVLPPVFPQPSFEAMGEELGAMFRAFKDPVAGRDLVIDQNIFVEKLLPEFANRTLGEQASKAYGKPYEQPADREPLLAWPREIPVEGEPKSIVALMAKLKDFMTTSEIPFLMLYADPGVLVSPKVADWYTENMKSIESVYVGQGLHFIQEDNPFAIGRALADWIRRTP